MINLALTNSPSPLFFPHISSICSDIAHLQYQESGAAESIIGCKLLAVPHQEGKITAKSIIKKLKSERAFGKHSTSPRILSITQPTEVGTVYSLDELAELADLCKEEKLLLHMDGSRIYNALDFLNIDFQHMLQFARIDIMSLGGTKNGLMGAEAVLIFNSDLMAGSDHLHKQTLSFSPISKVLKAAHFDRIRIMKCTHYDEWDAAKRFRQKYFFDPLSIADPYTWTFNHTEHAHLILYQGVEIIGYAHIQFWPDQRAALRIIVIDEAYRNYGLGSQFLHLCERWLKMQSIRSLHVEARLDVIKFYQKNEYARMPFIDPSGTPTSSHDVPMGKIL